MTSPTAPDQSEKLKNGRGNHRLLWGITLALGVLLVFLIFSHRGLYQIYRFRTEKQQLEQETARLAAENDRLARTIDRLQHDPDMIQDLIRRELNFVKKNEIIFQLPPESGAKAPLPPSSPKAEPPASKPAKPGPRTKSGLKSEVRATLEGAPKNGGPPKAEPANPGRSDAGHKPGAASSPR